MFIDTSGPCKEVRHGLLLTACLSVTYLTDEAYAACGAAAAAAAVAV